MYGQKNYLQPQGIPPTKYRINQIGCYLVAFCNLLKKDFGIAVDPIQLNAHFRDRKVYIDVDDGVRDDLFWQAVTTYKPHIVVEKTSKDGKMPPHTRSIVRIKASNRFGTHFCAVSEIKNGVVYVVDSWDGQKRPASYYGAISGWASYKNAKPQPVAPVKPAPKPAPAINANQVKIQPGWGISHALKYRGYPKTEYSSEAKWNWVAKMNGKPSWKQLQLDAGDVITLPSYVVPQPKPIAVATPEPAPAPVPTPQPTTEPTTPPPAAEPKKTWKDSFIAQENEYIATETVVVKDLEGLHIPLNLTAGKKVDVGGTFTKDGETYFRSARHVLDNKWYGIPMQALKPNFDEDSDLYDLDMSLYDEAKELVTNLTAREKIVALVAGIQGFFAYTYRKLRRQK